jgi:hypothetical protein
MVELNGITTKENDGFEVLCNESVMEAALGEYWQCAEEKSSKAGISRRKHIAGNMFLKGPVPIQWLIQAAVLKGKCLHLGVVLWLLAGLRGSSTFKLEHKWLVKFGISRWAVSSNLKKLEQADLIRLNCKPGRSPVITILRPEQP